MSDELPSAADNMKEIALAEAEKASAYMRKQAAADAEKRELLERFEKPSGVSDEERLKRAGATMVRPHRLQAIDFTGKELWARPIRETAYRGPCPGRGQGG
jgi:hypothetical protein